MEALNHFFKGLSLVFVPELGIFFGILVGVLTLILLIFSVIGVFKLGVDYLVSRTAPPKDPD